jgi:penicillin-binding protein 1A
VEALVVVANRRRHTGRGGRLHVGRWVGALGVLAVAAVLALAGTGASRVEQLLTDCSLDSVTPKLPGATTFVYAADGSQLGAVPSARNRQPVPFTAMGTWLPRATIAIEDRRFWEHGALDYAGILRAAIANVEAGKPVQGGSTLEVQLVRNLYIGADVPRTLDVKIKEACLANQLSKRWTKQRILGAYLNIVYYGHHAYGAEAAARTYFAKPASRLSVREAALIAGLPQAPSLYDPFVHPAAARARRNEVLKAMLDTGVISPLQYAHASERPLGLRPGHHFQDLGRTPFGSYVEQQLISRFGAHTARYGGLRVTTTLDKRLQRLATNAIRAHLPGPNDPAAAIVAIDPRTGAVRALAAISPGRHLDFNLATQSHRQAGSAFKPFTLVTALEQRISPSSVWSGPPELQIHDERCLNGYEPWDVHNYADESAGTMTLADATAHSVNTIYAQLVAVVGPEHVVATAHRMGIRSPLKAVCSITLGAVGVSPLEMANAYATLAARGVYRPASPISTVRFQSGRESSELSTRGKRALGRDVADATTSILQGVLQKGTGTAAFFGRPAAGKTGTAESFVDAWFCGYVPQLATCVWVGYPQAEIPLEGVEGWGVVFGGSIPALIWHDFMSAALAHVPVQQFAAPDFSLFTERPSASVTPTSTGSATTRPATTSPQPAPPPAPSTQPPATQPPPSPHPPSTQAPPIQPPATQPPSTQPAAPPPPPI